MKLHVVFDSDGEIVAAAQLDSEASVRARPVPDDGRPPSRGGFTCRRTTSTTTSRPSANDCASIRAVRSPSPGREKSARRKTTARDTRLRQVATPSLGATLIFSGRATPA